MPGLTRASMKRCRTIHPYDLRVLHFIMDCRVKPGNDARGESVALLNG
jgi:hypothetical protein